MIFPAASFMIIIQMKASISLGLLALLTLLAGVQSCNDNLNCFKTKLFNFNSPKKGLYPIKTITDHPDNSYSVLAYGDFNNDLWTDFVALLSSNNSLGVYIWNKETSIFDQTNVISPEECEIESTFLFDADVNGLLDITIWGKNGDENCLLLYLHEPKLNFALGASRSLAETTQPFVLSYGGDNGRQKVNSLCVYENGSRTLLKYDDTGFIASEWSLTFNSTESYSKVKFADPHWNSYVDLTGDCRSDVVIVDEQNNMEIWVNEGKKFSFYSSTPLPNDTLSLFFSDINYDGGLDLITASPDTLSVFFNKGKTPGPEDFCCPKCKDVKFSETAGLKIGVAEGESILQGNCHIADIDINGYPDVLLPLNNGSHQYFKIYLNMEGEKFEVSKIYDTKFTTTGTLYSASFIDFLENGILDFMINYEEGGEVITKSIVNNYLQQNYFYIKGYGVSGSSYDQSCQIVGASFYWVNSLGSKLRSAYVPQVIQTSYNALQLPYAYSGLGRANNYVDSFTLGVLGQQEAWSPIIPNSQLVVYAPDSSVKEWQVRIFVLPTDSLVYVVIVCSILLTILGAVLIVLKCKQYRKKEEPLMEFLH